MHGAGAAVAQDLRGAGVLLHRHVADLFEERQVDVALDVAGGACTVSKGAAKEATVALTLAAPDFLRLITGKLNGVNAFMSGKLKLKGDMMLAQTMQGWFDQS